jgi:site-specific DNA recombinase
MTRAITYSRVSTREQKEQGYSLRQQREALRSYCEEQGWQVVAEIEDGGHSGASLERPGLERMRDLVAQGGVDVVLAQDRDRFAREPAYIYILKQEFAEYGTRLRALNSRGDDSPEGELQDGILDQLAKFERAKLTERIRRGRTRKAQEGRILRGKKHPFGFRYSDDGKQLVIHEPEMEVVERMFALAAKGMGAKAIANRLNTEGRESPTGGRWVPSTVRRILNTDLYVPYSREELSELGISADALAKVDADEAGVWWYSRKQVKITGKTPKGVDENGQTLYTIHTHTEIRPVEERVGVPVPAYLPRALVDEAHAAMRASKPKELKNPAREWELRGLIRCSCGWKMVTHTARPGGRVYPYYACSNRRVDGRASGCEQRAIPALQLEQLAWARLMRLLMSKEEMLGALDAMIERERSVRGNPEQEAEMWAARIADLDRQRQRAQDAYLAGAFEVAELKAKLAVLDEQRTIAEKELAACRSRHSRTAELQQIRDSYADGGSMYFTYVEGGRPHYDADPEQRREAYRKYRVQVEITPDGQALLTGVFGRLPLRTSDTPP